MHFAAVQAIIFCDNFLAEYAALQHMSHACGRNERQQAIFRRREEKISSIVLVNLIELKIKLQDTPRWNSNAVIAD